MTVTELHIYPVKSTHRVSVRAAEVKPWGLAGDRRWMLVDEAGRFLTQREVPRLALVQVNLTQDGISVHAPKMPGLHVGIPEQGAQTEAVDIWKDTVEARVAGDAACGWFSTFLGRICRLVYLHNPYGRPADTTYAAPGSVVSFADGYPLLITSEASLEGLNARMADNLPMTRFRPNVVVDGHVPFDEDNWSRIKIGSMNFQVVKPCTRCVITTVDQESATTGKEPLRTLSSFRKVNGKVYFGENLVPEGEGFIHVGDAVEVVERRAVRLP